MTMPVLATIRALLKFKDHTTIAEIASTSGLSRKVVLETINRNGQFVWRNRKNGHITKVDPQSALRKQLWEIRDTLIGKMVKYKYFNIGVKVAPRLPVFLGFRDSSDL